MAGIVIFDLGDTLVRNPAGRMAWHLVCRELEVPTKRAGEIWHTHHGQPLAVHLADALNCRRSDPQVGIAVDRFWALCMGDFEAEPQARRTLEHLRHAGYTLYLSNDATPHATRRELTRLGWNHLFALALGTSAGCPQGHAHYARFREHAGLGRHDFAARATSVGAARKDMRLAAQHGVRRRIGYVPSSPGALLHRQTLAAAGATECIAGLDELLSLHLP